MTINQFRSLIYATARSLGNVQAVKRSVETRSAEPIVKRVGRVYAGRFAGSLIRALFPPTRG